MVCIKLYISVDMEGISGVVSWSEQTGPGGHDFDRFRRLMTAEANAVVEGALEAGASEVVVNDAHGGMRNIILEELNSAARLISGSPKPLGMVEGLDETFDAAFLVGYHARAGQHGVLSHTYAGHVLEYRINGQVFGETGMNAALAGSFGVPVVLVAGDSAAATEARELLGPLGPIETVAVKRTVGRYAADNLHPEKARALLKEAACAAVRQVPKVRPLVVDTPVNLELKFTDTGSAEAAALMPFATLKDPLTVVYTAPDYLTVLRATRAMIALAAR